MVAVEWQDRLQLMAICCNLCTHNNVARDIGSSVSVRHLIHVSCACVSDLSSTLHFALFTVSLILYFILLIFHFIFYVGRFGDKIPCALPRMRSLTLWSTTPLSQFLVRSGWSKCWKAPLGGAVAVHVRS